MSRNDWLRIVSALSLLLILFVWFDVSSIFQKLTSIDTDYVFLALLFLVLQLGLSCARWLIILDSQDVQMRKTSMVSIYGFSLIANLLFITSLAGMSVRAALLVRQGTELVKALAAVMVERIAALAGLIIASAAGLVFAFPLMSDYLSKVSITDILPIVLVGLLIVSLISYFAYRKFSSFRNFMEHFGQSFSSVKAVSILATLSIAVVLSGICALAILAKGMGLDIEMLFFISIMPIVALISSLPISIGGWGVREGAMVAGLAIFSVPGESALALSLLYGLSGVFVTIFIGTIMAYSGKYGLTGRKK